MMVGGTLIISVMLKLIAAIRLAQADLHKYRAYMQTPSHERHFISNLFLSNI